MTVAVPNPVDPIARPATAGGANGEMHDWLLSQGDVRRAAPAGIPCDRVAPFKVINATAPHPLREIRTPSQVRINS